MDFNFDEIVAKIPAVLDFKRRHYYDDCCDREKKRPDQYAYHQRYIHVVDYHNREGMVTPSEFNVLCGMSKSANSYSTERAILLYNSGLYYEIDPKRLQGMKKFKLIEVLK